MQLPHHFTNVLCYETTPTTRIKLGSPATKLAAETELAETMTEPTADAGRSVDRTLPGVGASVALSPAPHPVESATLPSIQKIDRRSIKRAQYLQFC